MKALGLVSLLTFVTIGLTSFVDPPVDAFVMPAIIREPRPQPLPYTLPIAYLVPILRWTDDTGIPVWMACRLFAQESTGDPLSGRWNPRAVSWMGAQGMAQIMPVTRQMMEVRYNGGNAIDPFDPEQAIHFGLLYLADLHAISGSWRIAIMAYNGGLGHWMNPRRYGEWQPESVDYVRAIMGERR